MEGNKKRPCNESYDQTEPSHKRLHYNNELGDQTGPNRKRQPPEFISVIRGAMMFETIKGICSSLEPMIQRVVHDEVKKALMGALPLYGNRQYYIENPLPTQQDPRLKFAFANQVSQQIYTGNQITDDVKNPIQIQLVDNETGVICENGEGSSAKVQIVVIDGDLEEEGCDSNKFNTNIVRPRERKAALLSGNTIITLKNGVGNLEGVSFTDNSKCTRSGKFRLGVRVDSEASTSTSTRNTNRLNIKEGLSGKFAVKDHRGELNKKHYPPSLDDDVWRLDNIARDGQFHKRLRDNGINKVQDFLRFFVNSGPDELQKILGMAKNTWDKVIKHARTCQMGQHSYLFKSDGYVIKLNPIGQILEASIYGVNYLHKDIPLQYEAYVQWLASQASQQWNKLDKVSNDYPLNQNNSYFLSNVSTTVEYGNGGNLSIDMLSSSTPNYPSLTKSDSFNCLMRSLLGDVPE
ncbi:hypothetical protein LUZ60_013657 [Juncus effusus]|nr:hypothetical protein LUZ60_013657 [Juncus effusus]